MQVATPRTPWGALPRLAACRGARGRHRVRSGKIKTSSAERAWVLPSRLTGRASPGKAQWQLRLNLTMRRTDVFVHEQLRLTPLSVSADRIAHVAFRCAVLLAKLDATDAPVDRSGSGPVAEVYPAASLHSWGLTYHSYKQKTSTDALGMLVEHPRHEAPWLDCATHEQAMRRSHEFFDAVIAAMTARAAALGQTFPRTGDHLAAATAEGLDRHPRSADQRTAVGISLTRPSRQMRAFTAAGSNA